MSINIAIEIRTAFPFIVMRSCLLSIDLHLVWHDHNIEIHFFLRCIEHLFCFHVFVKSFFFEGEKGQKGLFTLTGKQNFGSTLLSQMFTNETGSTPRIDNKAGQNVRSHVRG